MLGTQEQTENKEGILLVNKAKDKSAFYLVRVLRKKSNIKKIGHAGTLDPFATGVMVMLIGKSFTKLSDTFINHDKEYEATLKLGKATNTFDCEGEQTFESSYIPQLEEVLKTLKKFQGDIKQIPPMFSAKKIKGQKLYNLARKGIEVERAPVSLHVKITLVDFSYPFLKLKVACSKGTYIRSLTDDIGRDLKTYAHLVELVRTRSGPFEIKDCIDAKELSDPSFSYIPHLRKS